MKTELKEVLHLYLGCNVRSESMGIIFPFTDINASTYKLFADKNVVLILRPLSDMTEEEEFHLVIHNPSLIEQAENTCYLLSRHLDLFGLIDSGQAIDKTKL